MKQERILLIEGRKYTLLISDEPQALLEAKASERAVLGCMSSGETDEKGDSLCNSFHRVCHR